MTVRTKALLRAAEAVGGAARLRELLRVSSTQLGSWLTGQEQPPMDAFLKAVDLIAAAPPPQSVRPVNDAVLQSRRLRREAQIVRSGAMLARERAVAIQAKILAGHRARLAQPMSPLRFLQIRFSPTEGVEMADAAVQAAVNGTDADRGNMQLLCPEGLRIVAHRGFERAFLDYFGCVRDEAGSVCSAALKARRRMAIPDVAKAGAVDTRCSAVLAAAGVRAVQSTPLLATSGELVGMLSTHYEKPCEPTERELDVIDRIARRAVFWLETEEV